MNNLMTLEQQLIIFRQDVVSVEQQMIHFRGLYLNGQAMAHNRLILSELQFQRDQMQVDINKLKMQIEDAKAELADWWVV